MDSLLDFFTAPYTTTAPSDIVLELTGAVFGIISVLFAKREHIWVYPTGLVSTGIYTFVCFQFALYGDLLINVYYTLMSVYGWVVWSKNSGGNPLSISRCDAKDWRKVALIFVSTSILVTAVYCYSGRFHQMTDYFDTLTTGIFFAGMWLMANKKLENWRFWMVGNAISIPLYFVKGLGFTGVQFAVFFFLAYQGQQQWKARLDQKLQGA